MTREPAVRDAAGSAIASTFSTEYQLLFPRPHGCSDDSERGDVERVGHQRRSLDNSDPIRLLEREKKKIAAK